MTLEIKTKDAAKFDVVTLGELLLRFDPGEYRIHNARDFRVWDGGAEYNVAANMSRVFRKRVSIVSRVFDDPIGRLAEGLAREAGIDLSNIDWSDSGRNGMYFIERGQSIRGPRSAFDRADTAVSALKVGEIHWDKLFAGSVRWFHTGGVFTALSETTPDVAAEGMAAAKKAGAIVSYDLNYRDSLWKKRGGLTQANRVNAQLLPHADIVFGCLDFESRISLFDQAAFERAAKAMREKFPNLKAIVSTLRETHSANRHDLGAASLFEDTVTVGRAIQNVDVIDRVGSGDAFVAGFIDSMLESRGIKHALDCGVTLGALTMTTPGDTSMSTAEEVFDLLVRTDATARR